MSDESVTVAPETPALPASMILINMQAGGRPVERLRELMLNEIDALNRILQHVPEIEPRQKGRRFGLEESNIALATLGGLSYALNRLHESFETERTLAELEELYAKAELMSYPASEEEMLRTRQHCAKLGIVTEVAKCQFKQTGEMRFRVVSPIAQTNRDGIALKPDELIPSVDRPIPPLSQSLVTE